MKYALCATAHDIEVGNGAFRTTELGHNAVAIHLYTCNLYAVDSNDAVAGENACSFARTFTDHLEHE